MFHLEEKKNIVITILLLGILIGGFSISKGWAEKEYLADLPVVEEQDKLDINDRFDSEDILNNGFYYNDKVVEVNYQTTSQKEVLLPVLDFDTYYQIEINDNSFSLPDVELVDKNGNSLELRIDYFFKGINQLNYLAVSDFRTDHLGTYCVHYYVTNLNGQTVTKEITIDIIDNTKPLIEGYIEEYDPISDLTAYQPVISNSTINKALKIVFSDNDGIMYAEYYKALYEVIDGNNTLEHESMMNVFDIDLENDFYLYEDGEYHVRAYDYSGNYQEYIVIIDRTNPIVSVTYEQLDLNNILVTIETDEKVLPITGFTSDFSNKIFTKIYNKNLEEFVKIEDLAGNEIDISILIDSIIDVYVKQNNNLMIPNDYLQLNLNDGDISFEVVNASLYDISYSIDNDNFIPYLGNALEKDGLYTFRVKRNNFINYYSFYVSNQKTED